MCFWGGYTHRATYINSDGKGGEYVAGKTTKQNIKLQMNRLCVGMSLPCALRYSIKTSSNQMVLKGRDIAPLTIFLIIYDNTFSCSVLVSIRVVSGKSTVKNNLKNRNINY